MQAPTRRALNNSNCNATYQCHLFQSTCNNNLIIRYMRPPALRSAILVDVMKFVDELENARKAVEAIAVQGLRVGVSSGLNY